MNLKTLPNVLKALCVVIWSDSWLLRLRLTQLWFEGFSPSGLLGRVTRLLTLDVSEEPFAFMIWIRTRKKRRKIPLGPHNGSALLLKKRELGDIFCVRLQPVSMSVIVTSRHNRTSTHRIIDSTFQGC